MNSRKRLDDATPRDQSVVGATSVGASSSPWALVIAVAFAAVAGVASYAAGAYLTETATAILRAQRDRLVAEVELVVGQRVSWSAAQPSLTGGLVLHDVLVSDLARAERVSIRADLAGLLASMRPEAAAPPDGESTEVTRIEVTVVRPSLDVDLVEDRLLIESLLARGGDGLAAANSLQIEVRLVGGTVRARSDVSQSWALSAVEVDGTATISSAGIDARFGGSLSGAIDPAYAPVLQDRLSGSTRVTAQAVVDFAAGSTGVTIETTGISSSHGAIAPLVLRVEQDARGVSVRRIRDDDPLDLSVQWDAATGVTTASVEAARIRPSDLVTVSGPWGEYQRWLEALYTASASVELQSDGTISRAGGTLSTTVRDPTLSRPVPLSANVVWDGSRLTVASLSVAGESGRARFRGSWVPSEVIPRGTVTLEEFVWDGTPPVTGTIRVEGRNGLAALEADELLIAGRSVSDARATIGLVGSFVDVDARFGTIGGGRVVLDVRLSSPEDLSGIVEFVDVSIADALDIAAIAVGPIDAAALLGSSIDEREALRLEVNGALRIDLREGRMRIDVPWMTVIDPVDLTRVASVTGSWRDGTLLYDHLFLRVDTFTVRSDGLVRFSTGGTVDVDADVDVNGIAYPIRAIYRPGDGLVLSTPAGVDLRIRTDSTGAIAIAAVAEGLQLPLGQAIVDAQLTARIASAADWSIEIEYLSADGIAVPTIEPFDLALTGSVVPTGASLSVVGVDSGGRRLVGMAQLAWDLDPTVAVSLDAQLGDPEGAERYRISGRATADSLAADLRFDSAPIDRVTGLFTAGSVSGTAQLSGPLNDPSIRIDASASGLRIGEEDANLALFVSVDENGVALRDATISGLDRTLTVDRLDIARATGEISADMTLRTADAPGIASLLIEGTTHAFDRPLLEVLAERPLDQWAFAGDATVAPADGGDLQVYSFGRESRVTTLDRADGALSVRAGDDGSLSITTERPLPIRATLSGTITDGQIELNAQQLEVDIAALAGPLLEASGIEITGGIARGPVRVVGSIGDPDFFGTIAIDGFGMRLPFSPDAVELAPSALILEEKIVRLPLTRAEWGDAPVELDARLLLARFAPEQFGVSLTTLGETGPHIVSRFGPVDVDGYGRGVIEIGGVPGSVAISGDLRVYGSEIGIVAVDPEEEILDIAITVDLNLETGRSNQFIWPASDFPVLRGILATDSELAISVDSADASFSLQGGLELQSGDILYFDRNFIIREGSIVFDENEQRFDPRVSARAELREVTPDGPVRIFLVASQQSLSEFSPRLESNPPLTGPEIIAILGGNIFQTGDDGSIDISTALLSTSDLVTQFGVVRQFEANVREQFNLDLFAVRTSLLQNLLLTAIGPTDLVQSQLTPSLGTFLNDTSIFAGRYLGDSVFLEGLVSLRSADPAGIAAETGVRRLGGVLIDSEIRLEWQTPFFLIEWTLAPEHPEELFIRDNTFTFSWAFSY